MALRFLLAEQIVHSPIWHNPSEKNQFGVWTRYKLNVEVILAFYDIRILDDILSYEFFDFTIESVEWTWFNKYFKIINLHHKFVRNIEKYKQHDQNFIIFL